MHSLQLLRGPVRPSRRFVGAGSVRYPAQTMGSSLHSSRAAVIRTKSGSSFGFPTVAFWAKDVLRTGSLHPPNPILQSIPSIDCSDGPALDPDFKCMLPYHLEKATPTIMQQFKIDIAEWELALTGLPPKNERRISNIETLNRIESPVAQLLEVGRLFTDLASPPDQLKHWQSACSELQRAFREIPWRQSTIVFRALREEQQEYVPRDLMVDFRMRGAHLDNETEREELLEIEDQILSLNDCFRECEDYSSASKAARLQMVSDMYNWIGLKNLQALKLGYPSILEMYADAFGQTAKRHEIDHVCQEATSFLTTNLPAIEATLSEDVGAFLSTKEKPPSDEELDILKARFMFRKAMYLDGVLRGIADFCEAIFGIRVEQRSNPTGWNKNVCVVRLIDIETEEQLGTIFLDLFQDPYWRSDRAENLVMSRLFTHRQVQTRNPVAVVALKVTPTWDDAPTPLSWDDTRDLLFQFGNALQMIFAQASNGFSTRPPADAATFLANFMEMWVQNDGFLHRLVQLSQSETLLEEETVDILRKDLKKEKAAELINSIFVGNLELGVFNDFDARGDDTLASLQARIAEEFVPHDPPDWSDLSPLVDIFRNNALQEGSVRSYEPFLSSVLAAMVYEKFQNTDLRQGDEAKRLGHAVREICSKGRHSTTRDVVKLCGKELTSFDLQRVFSF